MFSEVPTIIGGLGFKIDYVFLKLFETLSSYPILLGRPWLYLAKAKDDWGKGTLFIEKEKQKVTLPMYPITYHGEIQDEET